MMQHIAIMQGTSSSGGKAQAANRQQHIDSLLQQVLGDSHAIPQQ